MRWPFAFAVILAISSILFGQTATYPYVLKTFAGAFPIADGDGGPATSALLYNPRAVAPDAAGNLYVIDYGPLNLPRLRVVTSDGNINLVSALQNSQVFSIAIGADGSVYFASQAQVNKLSPAGVITTIAGTGTYGFSGDGGPAVNAQLGSVGAIAAGSAGDVFIADGNRVREVTASDGKIQTIAGATAAGYTGDGGPAAQATLNTPSALAVDKSDNLYIVDEFNCAVRKVAGGNISTIAGGGNAGIAAPFKPIPARSVSFCPFLSGGIAVDNSGNVDFGFGNGGAVFQVSPGGALNLLAGNQNLYGPYQNGPATSVSFGLVSNIGLDAAGDLFITDSTQGRVLEVGADGQARTVAGKLRYSGDGGPAASALLNYPAAVAADNQGNVYIADQRNYRVRKVSPNGAIAAYAGTGTYGSPDGAVPAIQSPLNLVTALASDSQGSVYWGSSPAGSGPGGEIGKVTASGAMEILAGDASGSFEDTGIGGAAAKAALQSINGVAVDPAGNVYVSDTASPNEVFQISASSGIVSVFAGGGTSSPLSATGPATALSLNVRGEGDLAADQEGNIYIYDYGAGVVPVVGANGAVSNAISARNSAGDYLGVAGIAVDGANNLYLASTSGVYRLGGGLAYLIAGGGAAAPADGMIATSVKFSGFGLDAIAADPNGNLYVADVQNNVVWKLVVDSPAGLSLSGGNNQTGQAGWTLPNPLQVAVNGRAGVNVPGVTVNFAVTAGSAALSATSAVTDAAGTASVELTLGANPGNVTVTATVAGLAPVQFSAAAIAAPANGSIPCTITAAPSIASVNSATDFGGFSSFAPGSWIEIKGSNLAVDARLWSGADFQGSNAPTALDASSVTIGGKPAFVGYISGGQINAQVPADSNTGPVTITVTTCAGTSSAFTGQLAPVVPGMLAPASFNINGEQYLVAVFQDGVTYVGNSGLIPGVPFRPAKPGDTITAYGIGFGPVTPAIAPGTVAGAPNNISNFSLSFGATPATVTYAGLAPDAVGLYQFNIMVPQVADGDYAIAVNVDSIQVPQLVYLTVHN